jgi:hypothetical protein
VAVTTGITDVPGNPLSAEAMQTFIVSDAVFWVGVTGHWDIGTNWNTAAIPSVSDTVIISTPEDIKVTLDHADTRVANLYSDNRFDLTSFRELVVDDEFILNDVMTVFWRDRERPSAGTGGVFISGTQVN